MSSRRDSTTALSAQSSSSLSLALTEETLQAKLDAAIGPLSQQVTKMHEQQTEALTTLRELWNEMKQIARRLNQLDGKWM